MKYLKYMPLGLLFLFVALSINSSIEAKKDAEAFSFKNEANCQLQVYKSQLIGSFKNFSHIKGFFVMSLLGLLGFTNKKILYTGLTVASLTILTEGLQMWSPSRHCRVTDIIPNILGFLGALMLFYIYLTIKKVFFNSDKF